MVDRALVPVPGVFASACRDASGINTFQPLWSAGKLQKCRGDLVR